MKLTLDLSGHDMSFYFDSWTKLVHSSLAKDEHLHICIYAHAYGYQFHC